MEHVALTADSMAASSAALASSTLAAPIDIEPPAETTPEAATAHLQRAFPAAIEALSHLEPQHLDQPLEFPGDDGATTSWPYSAVFSYTLETHFPEHFADVEQLLSR